MELNTTMEEDRRAKFVLEQALEEAYSAGKNSTFEELFESSEGVPDVDQLWEELTGILGIVV